MENKVHYGGFFILLTFIAAFVATLIPLTDALIRLRPEWVSLVLIYWCVYIPERVGVLVGWVCGLFLDILFNSLLGQYALALAVVAFLSYQFSVRIKLYPMFQQSLIVMLLVAVFQIIILWIKGINSTYTHTLLYWLPSLSSALLWPFVFFVLSKIQERYGIV